jgi:hypothetical protein
MKRRQYIEKANRCERPSAGEGAASDCAGDVRRGRGTL